MDFAGDRLYVAGATHTPQIAPYRPTLTALATPERITNGGELKFPTVHSFLCEFTLCCGDGDNEARAGFRLHGKDGRLFDLSISRGIDRSEVRMSTGSEVTPSRSPLPPEFDPNTDHLIRVECSGPRIKVMIDGHPNVFAARLTSPATSIVLYADASGGEFAALSITDGFEELFDGDLEGWDVAGESSALASPQNGEIRLAADSEFSITHRQIFGDCEFAANLRLADGRDAFDFGVQMLDENGDITARLSLRPGEAVLEVTGSPASRFEMSDLDLGIYHQLRLVRYRGLLAAAIDERILTEVEFASGETRVSVFSRETAVFAEMVRATSI